MITLKLISGNDESAASLISLGTLLIVAATNLIMYSRRIGFLIKTSQTIQSSEKSVAEKWSAHGNAKSENAIKTFSLVLLGKEKEVKKVCT